jgi:hypothetical protein
MGGARMTGPRRVFTVFHRSTAVDVRTGAFFRWRHTRVEEADARAYCAEVNAGKLNGLGSTVVAWLEGEPEPPP